MTRASALLPGPGLAAARAGPGPSRNRGGGGTTESPRVRRVLIGATVLLLLVLLVLPLVVVFYEALADGWAAYRRSVVQPDTWAAVRLTLLTAVIAVPLNTVFGVAAAWAIAKFRFRGRSVLTALIDLPFSVSPVVAGLCFVLIFGAQGWYGALLGNQYELTLGPLGTYVVTPPRVIFALPGIVLATVFITFPFVARELIPLMESQGTEEEQAARVLGAGGWQTFVRVTLPNIKWGLLYGVILCNARAMGEFGAVYVVSGNYAGQITLPLQVERAYYASRVSVVPAFAAASLLGLLAVVTLIAKAFVEWKFKAETTTTAKADE